jgi:hypothetical protein
MSTNRNWELEHAYTLQEVRDYIKEEGAGCFLSDLQHNYPEVYDALTEEFKHRALALNQKAVPALLREYRK